MFDALKSGKIKYSRILFLDIETAPTYQTYEELDPRWQELWDAKSRQYNRNEETPAQLYSWAGVHAEFSKIVCIACGYLSEDNELRTKVYYQQDERELLLQFSQLLDNSFSSCTQCLLVAHNGVEFDYPFIARRMIINNLPLPELLNVPASKSWSNPWLIDTMQLWKFGDYKASTSLDLLAACFNISSSKAEMKGNMVSQVYHEEGEEGLKRICEYCVRDIEVLAKVFLHMAGVDYSEMRVNVVDDDAHTDA